MLNSADLRRHVAESWAAYMLEVSSRAQRGQARAGPVLCVV